MEMLPGIEISEKHTEYPKGTLKIMRWNLYMELIKSKLIIMI